MRLFGVMFVMVASFVGCADVEPCPFDTWPDDATAAVFMDNEPTCEERQIWYDVHEAVVQAWGSEPEPVRVWFIRSTDQMVYLSGKVQAWPALSIGMSDWGHGDLPNLYVATFDNSWSPETIMCHEMVHVYWRLRDHDDEFTNLLWDLLDIVWAPEPCGNIVHVSTGDA